MPFFMCYTVENVPSNTTWQWGETCPVLVFNTMSNDPACNGECPIYTLVLVLGYHLDSPTINPCSGASMMKTGPYPGLVVCRTNLEIHTIKLLLRHISVLVHFQAVATMLRFLAGEGPQHGTNYFQPQSGGAEEEDPNTLGQFLDPALNN